MYVLLLQFTFDVILKFDQPYIAKLNTFFFCLALLIPAVLAWVCLPTNALPLYAIFCIIVGSHLYLERPEGLVAGTGISRRLLAT